MALPTWPLPTQSAGVPICCNAGQVSGHLWTLQVLHLRLQPGDQPKYRLWLIFPFPPTGRMGGPVDIQAAAETAAAALAELEVMSPPSSPRLRQTTFGATLDFIEALCDASSGLTSFAPVRQLGLAVQHSPVRCVPSRGPWHEQSGTRKPLLVGLLNSACLKLVPSWSKRPECSCPLVLAELHHKPAMRAGQASAPGCMQVGAPSTI